MAEIVRRLRQDAIGWEMASNTATGPFIAQLEREAAEEIERLRAALKIGKEFIECQTTENADKFECALIEVFGDQSS